MPATFSASQTTRRNRLSAMANAHPLKGCLFRLKYRRDRRPGLPIEPVWLFYPRYVGDTIVKLAAVAKAARHLYRLKRVIRNDPNRLSYMDQALTPVTE